MESIFNEKLIELIRGAELLYNKTNQDYRDAGKKENRWKMISEELGQSGKADRMLKFMFIKVPKSPENFGNRRFR